MLDPTRQPMRRIHIIETGLPATPPEDAVGLMFECAPDASFGVQSRCSFGLTELLGDFDDLKDHANALASTLLDAEPKLRGIQQLGIFRERVIAEIQIALATQHLDRKLHDEGISDIRFAPGSQLAAGFAGLRQRLPASRQLSVDVAVRSGRSQTVLNGLRRLRGAGFSGGAIIDELFTVANRLDPYRRWRPTRPRRATWSPDEIWFYTTAYTFTAAGLLYEPYFPSPFRFLVENPRTGGWALAAQSRPFVDLYTFSRASMAPRNDEVSGARRDIEAHLLSVPLRGQDALARDQFLKCGFMAQFWDQHLPRGLFATSLFEEWIDRTAPKALVTGNYVFEGYAMQAAQRHGIPSITLQHGLFIDYCQYITPAADAFIVRGQFWKDFLPREAAAKALVLNPDEDRKAGSAALPLSQRKALVFLTAPYILPFWNEAEIDEILGVALSGAEKAGLELIVRVHPMESVAAYEQRVRRLRPNPQIKISFSQGAGLDAVLARSRLAITYFSTIFQDCLRHQVPIVSLGWHDFAPKKLMEKHRIFHFANSLRELESLIAAGASGGLPSGSSIEPFLASSRPGDIRAAILGALDPSRSTPQLQATS